jgi:hypothetical protein
MGSSLSPGKGDEVPVNPLRITAGVRCGILTFGLCAAQQPGDVGAYGRVPKWRARVMTTVVVMR